MRLSDYVKDSSDYVFGWLGYTGQADYERTCLLRESDNKIELIIPFQGRGGEIDSWFMDPDQIQTLDNPNLPPQIWVKDALHHDSFCLINPRVTNWSISPGTSLGHAILSPDYVVKGAAGFDYSQVNKLCSYTPELTAWTGLSSLKTTYTLNPDSTINTYTVGFHEDREKDITTTPGGVSLELVPTGSSTEVRGLEPRYLVQGAVNFQSSTEEKVTLKKHLEHHLALSSLLSIITWRNIGFKSLSVLAEDDVTLTLGNDTVGPFPRPVMTNLHDPWTEPRAHKPYLFRYTDIGQAGLAKWFELRRTYENPLNEFSYIARMHEALTLQSQILIYGTAFEELGGVIAKENSEKTSRSIEKRIQRILSDCELELFSNDKTISSAIANTYNAIKHTDFQREEMTRQDALAMDNLFSIATACRALALLWIGSKLGCGEKFVENLTEESAIATPIRQWL